MNRQQKLSVMGAPRELGYQRMRDWLHERCGMIYPEKKKRAVDSAHAESLRALRGAGSRSVG